MKKQHNLLKPIYRPLRPHQSGPWTFSPAQGRELYKCSHNAWGVGEMMDRKYDWSKFTKESLYGVPTPHDNSGSEVRNALHWLTDAQKWVLNIIAA